MSLKAFDALSLRVAKIRLEFETADRILQKESAALVLIRDQESNCRKAQMVVQDVAKEIQSRAYSCIAGIVSQCLEAVFDEPYTFRVEFVQSRGRTEVQLGFEKNGQPVDPMAAAGGGVVDVAAFALRLASLILLGSKARRFLVLDEPFKFLSENHRARIRELLVLLSDQLSLQIVMVTHIHELEVGKVVSLG